MCLYIYIYARAGPCLQISFSIYNSDSEEKLSYKCVSYFDYFLLCWLSCILVCQIVFF